MSTELPDGTIVPNFLGAINSSLDKIGWEGQYTDYSLRVGRVVKAYSAGQGQNINKTILYDVETVFADGEGGFAPVIFNRCQVASLFGGVADYVKWTPRITNFDSKTQIGLGSKVLLLSVNGNRTNAYIVGGIPHPEDSLPNETFENNHHLKTEFNGVNFLVNNDGDFVLQHRGATNPDGSIIDNTSSNTFISMDKDGLVNIGVMNADVYDAPVQDFEKPFFRLDKNNDLVDIFAKDEVNVTTDGHCNITTTTGLILNGRDEAFLQATTYRQEQRLLHQNMMALLQTLSTLLANAGSNLTAAGVLHLIPITGPIVAAPNLSSAGAALNAAGPIVAEIQAAINQFEQFDEDYLSRIHFHSDPVG